MKKTVALSLLLISALAPHAYAACDRVLAYFYGSLLLAGAGCNIGNIIDATNGGEVRQEALWNSTESSELVSRDGCREFFSDHCERVVNRQECLDYLVDPDNDGMVTIQECDVDEINRAQLGLSLSSLSTRIISAGVGLFTIAVTKYGT